LRIRERKKKASTVIPGKGKEKSPGTASKVVGLFGCAAGATRPVVAPSLGKGHILKVYDLTDFAKKERGYRADEWQPPRKCTKGGPGGRGGQRGLRGEDWKTHGGGGGGISYGGEGKFPVEKEAKIKRETIEKLSKDTKKRKHLRTSPPECGEARSRNVGSEEK